MNKSKFLKKSLAVLLAVLMATAMIPLSAAAAAPAVSGAAVTTDVNSNDSPLAVDNVNHTIKGEISTAATSFTLKVLPKDAKNDAVSVSYLDLTTSNSPVKSATPNGNDIWEIQNVVFTDKDYLNETGDTVTMTIYVKGPDNANGIEYTVTLNLVEDPSNPTLNTIRVWSYDQTGVNPDSALQHIPQLGNTVPDQMNKVMNITVPYNTAMVWVRDFDVVEGAVATVELTSGGTAELKPNTVLISDWTDPDAEVDGADFAKDSTGAVDLPNVILVPVKVTAGTFSADYTLRITRGAGVEKFTEDNAIDYRIFSDEGKMVVVLPFGYTADNTGADGNIPFKPVFDLAYASTGVPTVTLKPVTTAGASPTFGAAVELTSGETSVKIDADAVDLTNYDYAQVAKRLQNAKDFNDTLFTSSNKAGEVTVKYSESMSRTYDLILVEPQVNYESKITGFDIGNETAEIDQENKTITITLPAGMNAARIPVSDIRIEASDTATITLPFQDKVKFVERADNDTNNGGNAGHMANGNSYAHDSNRSVTEQFVKAVHGTDEADIKINVNTAGEKSDPELNASSANGVLIRVTSKMGADHPDLVDPTDYTLFVKVNDTYVRPAITTLQLQSPDRKTTLDGKLHATSTSTDYIFTVEVPYKFKTTEFLEDYYVLFQKSVGSTVTAATTKGSAWAKSGFTITGEEDYLSTNTDKDGNYFVIADNGRDTSTKGSAIQVKTRRPDTNQEEVVNYHILLVRKAPSSNSSLKSFALTSNGTKGASAIETFGNKMSMTTVTAENRYDGRVVGKNISVALPWSHYMQNGETSGDITESHILDAMHIIAETVDPNASVWYAYDDADDTTKPSNSSGIEGLSANPNLWQYMVIPQDDPKKFDKGGTDIAALLADMKTDKAAGHSDGKIVLYVLSEHADVDLAPQDPDDGWGKRVTKAAVDALSPELYTVYTLTVTQAPAESSAVLNELTLVQPQTDRFGLDKTVLKVSGNVISGTVPYCVAADSAATADGGKDWDIFLDYSASNRAFVLGADPADKDTGLYTEAKTNPDKNGGAATTGVALNLAGSKNGAGYPSATVGHFNNWKVDGDSDHNTCTSTLLPNGGAYLKIGTDGKVKMFSSADAEIANADKIVLTNEDTSKAVREYTLNLKVAPASDQNLITKFEVQGQVGSAVIDNNTDTINVTVGSAVEKTALKTSWELSKGARVVQQYVNGDPMNFSTERLFTIEAEDGGTRTYRVNVTVKEGFSDVPENAWYYDYVMTAYRNDWIAGYEDGTFRPGNNMTRGQFAMVIAKIEGYKSSEWKLVKFSDVDPEAYYGPAVAYCADKGYVTGFNDGTFKPNNPITREQIAVLMCKAADLDPIPGNTKFADDAKIGNWAKPYINACVKEGLISGKENNLYDPKANLKRSEGATVLVLAFNK